MKNKGGITVKIAFFLKILKNCKSIDPLFFTILGGKLGENDVFGGKFRVLRGKISGMNLELR